VKKIRYAPRSSLDRQSLAGTDTHWMSRARLSYQHFFGR
jgi:hypothetical protein